MSEAATALDSDDRKALAKWAFDSETRNRLDAMIALASNLPGVPITPAEMDSDPWSFNCANGTLDLRTGALRPHDRKDLLTKLCPAAYDADAPCPNWDATIAKFFARPDARDMADMIGYLQRLASYALTGVVRDHVLPIAHGVGSNGKSTFFGALLGTFGPDYAMKATSQLLMQMERGREANLTERMALFGMRLVVVIETEAGRRLNEELVKELTGGDPIRGRRLYEDTWQFDPTHKLFMATNHMPIIRGTDTAIWRRLKSVPFTVVMPDADADKSMPEKLRAEAPGILSWCVRGCMDWQKRGLGEPAEVETATEEYRSNQDVLGSFLDECAVRGPAFRVKAGQLYGRYKAWAESANEYAMTQTAFGRALAERGIGKTKDCHVLYLGVAVRDDFDGCDAH